MDRLIGNTRLYQDRWSLYTALTQWLVQGLSHPIILIDWSPLSGDQEHRVLRASLPVKGRALTLYEEVHPHSKLGNRRVQQDFLATLKTMLPLASHPIIVADSGFRVPFYRYVEQTLGWHWGVSGIVILSVGGILPMHGSVQRRCMRKPLPNPLTWA
jgi:hypothetical protein